jgi:hypothetical protein
MISGVKPPSLKKSVGWRALKIGAKQKKIEVSGRIASWNAA